MFIGLVLLDSEAENLQAIVKQIVDELVATEQLPPEQQGAVIKLLLLKHK